MRGKPGNNGKDGHNGIKAWELPKTAYNYDHVNVNGTTNLLIPPSITCESKLVLKFNYYLKFYFNSRRHWHQQSKNYNCARRR